MRGRRTQPSSIDRLEPEIKRMIAELRLEHGWGIDEILAKLHELAKPISRSALARHTKSLDELGEALRHSREMAKVLVEKTDGMAESQVADLNLELMHAMVLRILTAEQAGELVTLDPKEAEQLASAMSKMASARKTDAERRRKDREEAKKEFMDGVNKVAADKSKGLTKETVDAIYHAVLGVA